MPSVKDFLDQLGLDDVSENARNQGAEELLSQLDLDAIKGTVFEEYLLQEAVKTRGEFKLCQNNEKLERYKGNDIFVEIPEGIKIIGEYAFYECQNIRAIDFPNGINTIEEFAFNNCKQLSSVELPDSLVYINHHAFNGCSNLKLIDIPNSVREIQGAAFAFCMNLERIIFPPSISVIEDVFYMNNKLKEIHVKWQNLDNVQIEPFNVDPNNCILFVPYGTVHKYRHHPSFSHFTLIIPE